MLRFPATLKQPLSGVVDSEETVHALKNKSENPNPNNKFAALSGLGIFEEKIKKLENLVPRVWISSLNWACEATPKEVDPPLSAGYPRAPLEGFGPYRFL